MDENKKEVVKLRPHYFEPRKNEKSMFHNWPIWPRKKVFYPSQGSVNLHEDEDAGKKADQIMGEREMFSDPDMPY